VQVKNFQHGQITHEGEAGQISSNYLPSRGGGLKCKWRICSMDKLRMKIWVRVDHTSVMDELLSCVTSDVTQSSHVICACWKFFTRMFNASGPPSALWGVGQQIDLIGCRLYLQEGEEGEECTNLKTAEYPLSTPFVAIFGLAGTIVVRLRLNNTLVYMASFPKQFMLLRGRGSHHKRGIAKELVISSLWVQTHPCHNSKSLNGWQLGEYKRYKTTIQVASYHSF
jgi:hypothetical protein